MPIVIFDPLATPQKVLEVVGPYPNSAPYRARADAVIEPDLSALAVVAADGLITSFIVPLRYWKHVAGTIVEWTQAEKDTEAAAAAAQAVVDAAARIVAVRAGARAGHVGFESRPLLLRALADIIRDEINILRANWTAYKVEVAAATSLADLKTRVAAMPSMPDRTLAQLRTAIDARVDSGTIDT